MIIIAGHASLIRGSIYEAPTNTLVEILASQKKDFVYIRHFLEGNHPSEAYLYKEGKIERNIELWTLSRPSALRYVSEVIATLLFCSGIKSKEKICFIGVDPLNALSGLLLGLLGKVDRRVYFTSDYSKNRFKNKLLNSIYHTIDRFVIGRVDYVWNVSFRIRTMRETMGVPAAKNIFLPNVPSPDYQRYLKNKRQKFTLVTLGVLAEQLDFEGIFQAIAALRGKYKDINLKIIGSGPKEAEFKKRVSELKLKERVSFLGHQPHDRALEEISQSGVGLALYNGNWGFNYYGDSMKCREYFCFGLPVLTTNTHSTVDDIEKYHAGVVSEMNALAYQKALETIFAEYDVFSKGSQQLCDDYHDSHTNALKEVDAW